MNRFDKLLKQRSSALSVFEKTRRKLNTVLESIKTEEAKALQKIEEHEARIQEEREAITFLKGEQASVEKTVGQIDGILS